MKKEKKLVKHDASGGQHPKDHHHVLSEIIPLVGTFHHHQLILLEWYKDPEQIHSYIQRNNLKGET